MRFISWLISLPILLVLLNFALANRHDVMLSFWPFDAEMTLPLSALTLGMLFAGLLMGAFITWIGTLHYRFEARRLRRELAAAKKVIEGVTPTTVTINPNQELIMPPVVSPKSRWFEI